MANEDEVEDDGEVVLLVLVAPLSEFASKATELIAAEFRLDV